MQGLFGIWGKDSCMEKLFRGMFALQHRGQVYCGIATTDGEEVKKSSDEGLVEPFFKNGKKLAGMDGFAGIGITSSIDEQPIEKVARLGKFEVGFEGFLTNHEDIKTDLFCNGNCFSSEEHVELVAGLIASQHQLKSGIVSAIEKTAGPCNIIALDTEGIYVARDPHGFKPLCLGKTDHSVVVSSGSCAFGPMGIEFVRDVEPGEVILLNESGITPIAKLEGAKKLCSFDWIYFGEPRSIINGIDVTKVRHSLGRFLAQADEKNSCHFSRKDTVVGPVPNSGIFHAEGYHLESGLPSLEVFSPLKYVLRTYNLPLEERKKQKARKLEPVPENIRGKKIVLVDDSIRSGITIRDIVSTLFEHDAKEVHVRIASPPSIRNCPFDYPPKEEERFIAVAKSVEEIRQFIGATSLAYQELPRVSESIGLPEKDLCLDCFKRGVG